MSNASLKGTPSIGGLVVGGTAGSVLFVNPNNILAQDNTFFFYDQATHELRIGSITTKNGKLLIATEAADVYGTYLDARTSAPTTNGYIGAFFDIKVASASTPFGTVYGHRIDLDSSRDVSDTSSVQNWYSNGLYMNMTTGGAMSSVVDTGAENNTGLNFTMANQILKNVTGIDYQQTNTAISAGINTARTYNNGSGTFLQFNYGNSISLNGNSTVTAGSLIKRNYGSYIDISGTAPAGSVYYGIYINGVTGATDANWAFYNNSTAPIFSSGKLGIKKTPTAYIDLAAGTTAATTAPLKFTSGPLMTSPEAGAVEQLTDDIYFTGTSTQRRQVAMYDFPTYTYFGGA